MMVVLPEAIPVNSPVLASMVPLAGVPLLQMPPPGVLLSVVVAFTHIAAVPVIAVGSGLTVTSIVWRHPVAVTV